MSISKNTPLKPSEVYFNKYHSANGDVCVKMAYVACPRCLKKLYAPKLEEIFNEKSRCKVCGQLINWAN